MRSIWNGSITFGLITIPVKLYTAVGNRSVDLHMLHETDGERIHYKRVCSQGHEVDWDEIVKGYEYEKGKWVMLTDEEMEALDTDSVRAIDIVTFAPIAEIDPIFFDKSYYVVPQESGLKAYRLLAEALGAEELVGIAKVAIRDKEHLAAVRLKDNMIVLETMHWPDEVRAADFAEFEKKTEVRPNEVKMARQLVQQLSGPFEPDEFQDDYREALQALIEKKVAGEEIVMPEREEEPEKVVDLMEALRASVEQAKKGRDAKAARGSSKASSGNSKETATKSTNGRAGNGKSHANKKDSQELSKKSRQELYERAKELDIEGRSDMNKDELVDAIAEAG